LRLWYAASSRRDKKGSVVAEYPEHRRFADRIRDFALEQYVRPVIATGAGEIVIHAGEVHSKMQLVGRMPAVCAALGSKQFREKNGLDLVRRDGPPLGASTTFHFSRINLDGPLPQPEGDPAPLDRSNEQLQALRDYVTGRLDDEAKERRQTEERFTAVLTGLADRQEVAIRAQLQDLRDYVTGRLDDEAKERRQAEDRFTASLTKLVGGQDQAMRARLLTIRDEIARRLDDEAKERCESEARLTALLTRKRRR
jgi:hypothetical protein